MGSQVRGAYITVIQSVSHVVEGHVMMLRQALQAAKYDLVLPLRCKAVGCFCQCFLQVGRSTCCHLGRKGSSCQGTLRVGGWVGGWGGVGVVLRINYPHVTMHHARAFQKISG
jgi:hypothetical protein